MPRKAGFIYLSKQMGKLKQVADKLKTVTKEQQENAALGIIRKNSSYILDLETAQLMAGKTSEDKPVTPAYRNPKYAAFKKSLNPAGVVDLKLTGEFHRSFFIKAEKFPLMFGATDEKTNELVGKYGESIFGLDKKSKDEMGQQIKQEVGEYYRSIFHV